MKVLRMIAVGSALIGFGAWMDCMYGHRCHMRKDTKLDDALDGTYPASDPTATQDFAIPVNRA